MSSLSWLQENNEIIRFDAYLNMTSVSLRTQNSIKTWYFEGNSTHYLSDLFHSTDRIQNPLTNVYIVAALQNSNAYSEYIFQEKPTGYYSLELAECKVSGLQSKVVLQEILDKGRKVAIADKKCISMSISPRIQDTLPNSDYAQFLKNWCDKSSFKPDILTGTMEYETPSKKLADLQEKVRVIDTRVIHPLYLEQTSQTYTDIASPNSNVIDNLSNPNFSADEVIQSIPSTVVIRDMQDPTLSAEAIIRNIPTTKETLAKLR
jgi:hypothetical protein